MSDLSAAPYERLARAETVARERFPQASGVKALWTPASEASDVMVEVWTGERGHARASTWIPSALDLQPVTA